MNVNTLFVFTDESPYTVCLNIVELSKQSEELKDLCEAIKKAIDTKVSAIEVSYDSICFIWDVWNIPGIRVNLPAMIDAEIELYQKD